MIEELIPAAFHNTAQYENNRCECDQSRLKARLRPVRWLNTDRTASDSARPTYAEHNTPYGESLR